MTREQYIASHTPSTLDLAVEDDCFTKRREAAHRLFEAWPQVNFNRKVYVRMAYLQGVFTDFPNQEVVRP